VRGSHAIQLVIDCTNQNLPPETLNGARGLTLLLEPLPHADAVEISSASLAADGADCSPHCHLLTEVQKRELQERFRKMRGRRQHP